MTGARYLLPLLLLAAGAMSGEPTDDELLAGIAEVESRGHGYDKAHNREANARGRYQITPGYWKDGTEWLGVDWPHTDAHDPIKARAVVLAYFARYMFLTAEAKARGHRGGPTGPSENSTIPYWRKVQDAIETMGQQSSAGLDLKPDSHTDNRTSGPVGACDGAAAPSTTETEEGQ